MLSLAQCCCGCCALLYFNEYIQIQFITRVNWIEPAKCEKHSVVCNLLHDGHSAAEFINTFLYEYMDQMWWISRMKLTLYSTTIEYMFTMRRDETKMGQKTKKITVEHIKFTLSSKNSGMSTAKYLIYTQSNHTKYSIILFKKIQDVLFSTIIREHI